jgi:hypothetical protein
MPIYIHIYIGTVAGWGEKRLVHIIPPAATHDLEARTKDGFREGEMAFVDGHMYVHTSHLAAIFVFSNQSRGHRCNKPESITLSPKTGMAKSGSWPRYMGASRFQVGGESPRSENGSKILNLDTATETSVT